MKFVSARLVTCVCGCCMGTWPSNAADPLSAACARVCKLDVNFWLRSKIQAEARKVLLTSAQRSFAFSNFPFPQRKRRCGKEMRAGVRRALIVCIIKNLTFVKRKISKYKKTLLRLLVKTLCWRLLDDAERGALSCHNTPMSELRIPRVLRT